MPGILVAGTTSDAGKSLVTTGLCRALRRRGLRVAPFKAQNMSNNSMVCTDGSEIGRAQYLQALAAGVEPGSLHNPVLLKPSSDRRSFVVVRGRPAGELRSGEYATGRTALAAAAFDAYDELAATCDVVVCEGAGSPAEINLREGDYVNMGLARHGRLPVVLVADIDRGGALAAIYGTWGLLDEADRALLSGYLVNKFRGDETVLKPGLAELTRRCGLPSYGVVPWLRDVWIDSEDALSNGRYAPVSPEEPTLSVAAVALPRTSNATDLDALECEPGVAVTVTRDPRVCASADLLVLPGSRATVADLRWLRESGIADVVRDRAAKGRPVLGICGGYQMLCERIDDPVESRAGAVDGLGLLGGTVQFTTDKVLGRPSAVWRGLPVAGYTIHHGRPDADGSFPGGATTGSITGTMWHGIFESDDFRAAWLRQVAETTGSAWRPAADRPRFAAAREAMIDRLADTLETHADVDRMIEVAGESR
ncbi:cobyric acid synthase [Flexivirga meconopsidis]|uniref:cobyric acid synthase n=1 Tax=Flexivirga meconopsidis TaxID=2977121 RepID=UPI00224049FC